MKIYVIYRVESGLYAGVSMLPDVGAGFVARYLDVPIPDRLPPSIDTPPEDITKEAGDIIGELL